jgi:hypothetical protein
MIEEESLALTASWLLNADAIFPPIDTCGAHTRVCDALTVGGSTHQVQVPMGEPVRKAMPYLNQYNVPKTFFFTSRSGACSAAAELGI